MKRFLLTSAALVATVVSLPAMAADMPVKAIYKAPHAHVFSWSGCYVGGNAGWIRGQDSYDTAMSGGFLNPLNGFSDPANRAPFAHTYSTNGSGFTGGVGVGCNYQTARSVWGVEADFNGSSLRESINSSYGPVTLPGLGGAVSSHTESVTKDLNWFSTFRARAGLAFDRVLVYATGGAAVGRYKSTTNIQFGSDAVILPLFSFPGSDTETRIGWVAGAGLEWTFMDNWSLKAEYLHLDFGSFSYQSPCVNATCVTSFTNAGIPLGAWSTNVRARENLVRFGINYKFGGGAVVASY